MSCRCFNKAAITNIRCAGIEFAADRDATCRHAPQQDDVAFVFSHGMCFNNTAIVYHAGKKCIFGTSIHDNQSAVGMNQPGIFTQTVQDTLVNLHFEQAVVEEGECGGTARSKCNGALLSRNRPHVAYTVAQKRHIATTAGVDGALIDNLPGAVTAEELIYTVERSVIKFESRGNQPPDVDLSTLPEKNAVGVDQVYLSVGVKLSEYFRAVNVINTVDCYGTG